MRGAVFRALPHRWHLGPDLLQEQHSESIWRDRLHLRPRRWPLRHPIPVSFMGEGGRRLGTAHLEGARL